GSASFAYNVNNWLSGVADFGGYHNGNVLNTGLDFTLSTYLFGPRISYRHWNRVTPFGEVLFGAERVSTSTATANRSDNGFAMTVGGGLDVKLAKHFSVRPVKVDYLLTRFAAARADPQSQKNLRVSTGLVFHFELSRYASTAFEFNSSSQPTLQMGLTRTLPLRNLPMPRGIGSSPWRFPFARPPATSCLPALAWPGSSRR